MQQKKPLKIADSVRQHIFQTLCSRDNLEQDAFTVTETPLMRGAEVCGIYFCLHGPRLLRLTAIWEAAGNTIRFYGSQGERFLMTRVEGSSLAVQPAA